MDAVTLKIIKRNKYFEFTNPGILKLPIEDIFRGGNSKSRNQHMQIMLRMVGFGDNAGSGFPTILATWEVEGWVEPELIENTSLNQVTLVLHMMPSWLMKLQELEVQIVENLNTSPEQLQVIKENLEKAIDNISIPKTEGAEAAIATFAKNISGMPKVQYEAIGKVLMDVAKQGKELVDILAKYNKTIQDLIKTIQDLTKTNGFVIKELIKLLQSMEVIFRKVEEYQNADEKEKYKKKNPILELLISLIKYPRQYMLAELNKQLPQGRRIKGAICVSRLLNLRPESIYQRIQKEVQLHQSDMNEATLNLFIDYLFDIAFSYIKYDLLLKILVDLDFPYHNAKEISKILIEIDKDNLSSSKVMDMMELKYNEIIESKKINNVSKDLLKILLGK